jgi:hypothetical protein
MAEYTVLVSVNINLTGKVQTTADSAEQAAQEVQTFFDDIEWHCITQFAQVENVQVIEEPLNNQLC